MTDLHHSDEIPVDAAHERWQEKEEKIKDLFEELPIERQNDLLERLEELLDDEEFDHEDDD